MVADALREGFALAHRRLRLIFIDLLWEGVWLAATIGLLLVVAGWFGNQSGATEWRGSDVPGLNGLAAVALLKQFWDAYAGQMFWSLAAILAISALLWVVLEAFCRARILASLQKFSDHPVCASKERDHFIDGAATPPLEEGSAEASPHSPPPEEGWARHQTERRVATLIAADGVVRKSPAFSTCLFSSLAKKLVLAAAALTLGLITFGGFLITPFPEWPALWSETEGALIISLVAFMGLAFFLTILDTLIRSDAIDLFGTDLIRVSGVIVILLLLEILIAASIAIIVITGLLNIGNAAEGIATVGLAVGGVLLMSLLHSYLLLVRFSAVGIMRHNVIEI